MALTVTPGGASDDAMLTLSGFKAYADARNWDYSGFDDTTAIEPAIRVGTVFVEGVGGPTAGLSSRWPGKKASASQRRIWPRTGAKDVDGLAIDADTIPASVEGAVAEAAWYELNNAGTLHAQINPSEVVKQEKVGPLSVTYQDGSTGTAWDYRPMLTVINDLLAPILIHELKGPSLYMQSIGAVLPS
jgi:hypothetical protein